MLIAALALTLCPVGPRHDCVVDGDTAWIGREKVRIADIDAPEIEGKCDYERDLAQRAKRRLLDLLNGGFEIKRTGTDRYGRTLAIITNRRGSIGDQLVREGLARTWSGRREPWC